MCAAACQYSRHGFDWLAAVCRVVAAVGLGGPVCVVVPLVFGKDVASVCLVQVQDQQVVPYLAARCLDHSFAVCVRPWRAGCGGENVCAVRAEHLVEGGRIFAITVAEHEA